MIAGLSLPDFAAQIVAEAAAKRDFKASTAKLVAANDGTITLATASDTFSLQPTRYALRQIGEHTQIPAKYVDRMVSEAPSLLADNLNHWFMANPANRLIRTHITGLQTLRAFLSDRYRPMDNDDLAAHILPILQKAAGSSSPRRSPRRASTSKPSRKLSPLKSKNGTRRTFSTPASSSLIPRLALAGSPSSHSSTS